MKRKLKIIILIFVAVFLCLAFLISFLCIFSRGGSGPSILLGALHITTDPPGAGIYLDEKKYGESPLTITDLQPGTYKLRVRLSDAYETYSETVRVQEGENQVTVKLEAK